MKIVNYPDKEVWTDLTKRPENEKKFLQETVQNIFSEVEKDGDSALLKFTLQFDQAEINEIKVNQTEFTEAEKLVSVELKEAIKQAILNIEKFHSSQQEKPKTIETQSGVECWRESRAIEKVGLYIPGGSAPLFSTVLMLGIPAKLAGCKQIILCTPPDKNGNIHPAILFAAQSVGISEVYKVGGIQAIAALTLGTESIPSVYKIFGPGNQYVTAAKQYAQEFKVCIDLPAGPSEVLVIADSQANPEFVAADLLSQAEHGADSQVILLSTDESILKQTVNAVTTQLEKLPRKEVTQKALNNSRGILFSSLDECFNFSNLYAPEHLILAIGKAKEYTQKIENAGSVFFRKLQL